MTSLASVGRFRRSISCYWRCCPLICTFKHPEQIQFANNTLGLLRPYGFTRELKYSSSVASAQGEDGMWSPILILESFTWSALAVWHCFCLSVNSPGESNMQTQLRITALPHGRGGYLKTWLDS